MDWLSSNNGTATKKRCFPLGPRKGVIKKTTEERLCSWKGAAIQGGLELRSRGIGIVRNHHQATTSEATAGWIL
jgi:hypothetical protein